MAVAAREAGSTLELNELIKSGFGPQGTKVLCSNPQNQSLVIDMMTDGTHQSLLLQKACQNIESIIGDNVMKFLLISRVALQAIEENTPVRKLLLQVSQCLDGLHIETTDARSGKTCSGNAWKHASNNSLMTENDDITSVIQLASIYHMKASKVICSKILVTSLANTGSYLIKKRLREILIQLLFPANQLLSDPVDLKQNLTRCLAGLSFNYVYHVPSSISETRAKTGFLLESFDSFDSFDPSLNNSKESVRTALLLSSLTPQSSGDTIDVGNKTDLEQVLHYDMHFTTKVIDRLLQSGIKLLLCAGQLSPGAMHLLRQNNIRVIKLIPKDTLIAIAQTNRTYPFSNALEMILEGGTSSLILAKCELMSVSRKRYILLQTSMLSGASYDPYTFLLCAPTTKQCEFLKTSMKRALSVIDLWLQGVTENGELETVLGGGVWEIDVIRQINSYISSHNIATDTPQWIALTALMKGLYSIPQALYYNSLPPAQKFLSSRKRLLYQAVFDHSSKSMVGIDLINECLVELDDSSLSLWPALEPAVTQNYLLAAVCKYLSQIIRVENCFSALKKTRR